MIQLTWQDQTLSPDGPPIYTSVTPAETVELQRLANGRRCLEIGAAFGYSTVALAQVATYVTSVDPHTWLTSRAGLEANVAAYGVADRVEVLAEFGYSAMPRLEAARQRFGLVFVDGDHEDAAVAHDIGWAIKLLSPGGVLALHDWDEVTCPGVRAAAERLLGPPGRLVDTLAVYEGFAP